MSIFTITARDGNARTGIIKTAHGEIRTPAFIPVATKAALKGLSPQQLDEIGFDSILCNTYHLYLQPGEKIIKNLGGLHTFMNYHKPIFTDSGGFQVFSLGGTTITDAGVTFTSHIDASKHTFTPERSIQIQRDLGADILFTFDECTNITMEYGRTKEALLRTHAWAGRSLEEFQKTRGHQALFGIVQGGRFTELREQSARFISRLPFDGYGLGSIFGNPKEETEQLVSVMIKNLPEEKCKHLLGIGAIEDIFTYVGMGLDTFDCVLPTRLGRVGYAYLTPAGGGNRENKFRMRVTTLACKEDPHPIDRNCCCSVCRNFSRAYLRHLWKAKELLFYSLMTYHNLWFFHQLMEKIRKAIKEQRFIQLKEGWIGNGHQ